MKYPNQKVLIFLILINFITSCSKESNALDIKNKNASRLRNPISSGEIQIGNQIWMARDLNVSKYRNGDPIPQVQDATQWSNLTTGAWCYYQNNSGFGITYGKLYNCYAVNDPRGLAPQGWHVPSDAEFTTLSTFLGGDAIAGGKLKATYLWANPNAGATNSAGFLALPGGWRDGNGVFDYSQYYGFWWTTTEVQFGFSYLRQLSFHDSVFLRTNGLQFYGHSVRCIKN